MRNLILLRRVDVGRQGNDVENFHFERETILELEVQDVIVKVKDQEMKLPIHATSELVHNDDPEFLR